MPIIIFIIILLVVIYGPHLWAKQLIKKYSKTSIFQEPDVILRVFSLIE